MKYLPILLILVGCTINCPDVPVIYDTIHVPIYRDTACYSCIDSVYDVRKSELLSLKQAALSEVESERQRIEGHIDSMYQAYLNVKQPKVYDNRLILADTLPKIKSVGFDSIGKPMIQYD